MLKRALLSACCIGLGAMCSPATAQSVPDDPTVISYQTLGMSAGVHGSVVAVASDATNRVWAVTPGRVSATQGGGRAPLFPFDVADTALPATSSSGPTRFTDVAFAVPTGNAGDGEHFYLSSTRGIAWGRLSSTVDHRGALLFDAANPVPEDRVNAVASDGTAWLWAATDGGLVLWDLADANPTEQDTFLDGTGEGAIRYLALSPWGDAAASDGDHVHLVDITGADTLDYQLPTGELRGLAFDNSGNLWAVTTREVGGHPQILKFEVNGTGDGLTSPPESFPLNPFVGRSAPVGSFAPTSVAVDPITDRLWVTAAVDGVPYREAFYQEPDGAGDLQADPSTNGWGVVSSAFEQHNVVYADPAGNAWFGMFGDGGRASEALNGYIVRLLTLDKSRYLGADTGVARLTDLTVTGGTGTLTITVTVGSETRDFTFDYTPGGTGQFSQTFSITPSGAAGGSGNNFLVSSSVDDVPVEASYTFQDANLVDRTITATASWANIVDFEDDFWIGGPCFLDTLGR